MKFQLLFGLLCLASSGFAQIQADSVLPAAEVLGIPYQKYTAGMKLQQIDSLALRHQQSQSLSQLLMQRSPLYLKEYGPGQMATVSFRGTGANHTAVLWNGLPINSPTLGQTDFSLVPLFALGDVQLQYGAGSALYGSGALGGSVHLQSQGLGAGNSYARARVEAGSFGRFFTGLAAGFTHRRLQTHTKIYHQQAQNDFRYTNTLLPNRPREVNRNSAFDQWGLVQDLASSVGKTGEMQLNLWWQQTHRQIQPMMGDRNSRNQQQDEHLRLNLQYRQEGQSFSWQSQAGWVQEALTYNGSPFRSRQLIGQLQGEWSPLRQLSLQAGGRINHLLSRNREYDDGQAAEVRTDLFAMLRWQLFSDWLISANLRQVLVAGYQAPLSPSLGLEGKLLQRGQHQLDFKASAGRSYRVPTFNERFWPRVGNPAIRPEQAWSAESSLIWELKPAQKQLVRLEQTFYSIWSRDWIQWRPLAGEWRPQNLQQVHSRGTESQLEWVQLLPKGELTLGGFLAYTRATNEKALQQYDWTVGRQLAFTPLWRAGAWAELQVRQWSGMLNWQHTGRRYTDGSEQASNSLPPFALLNAKLGRNFHYKQHRWHAALQAQNLSNKQYQNYDKRAMPGRSYLLTINYHLNL